jgi:hypothetical protein
MGLSWREVRIFDDVTNALSIRVRKVGEIYLNRIVRTATYLKIWSGRTTSRPRA